MNTTQNTAAAPMTITNDAGDALIYADALNAQFSAGLIAKANGHKIVSMFGRPPFHTFMNGSISIDVAARQAGKSRTLWIKVGQSVVVE